MDGICSMFDTSHYLPKEKLRNRIFLLFWLTFLLSLSFEISGVYQRFGWIHYGILLAGRVVCIAVVVYLNIFYFIPRLLRKSRYAWYILGLLSSAVLIYGGSAFFNFLINLTGGSVPVFSFSKAYLFTLIFTGVRISFLAYLLFLAMEWIDQRSSIQELEIEKKEVENKYLRNQLNPHFLFNTMNNLHGLILTDTKRASESVLRLSDFLQYMVYESSEDLIPLDKELQLVKDYIALERLRVDVKKKIELEIKVVDTSYKIAPLLLLPLIENGIKHGISVVEDGAFLEVNIWQQAKQLEMRVINSKRSKDEKGSGGIGLSNLQRRLELQYKTAYNLRFTEDAGTFEAHLKVPLHAV